jgi:two-component system chemotaxis response regulator CheB
MRDDGVQGLNSMGRSGGITVVQDTDNAPFPDMPQNALNMMEVEYVVRAVEIGLVLSGLIYQPVKSQASIPEDVFNEAYLAERLLTSMDDVEGRTDAATGFTCPDCGGVLWDLKHTEKVHSYRCIAGHAFTPDTLLHLKSKRKKRCASTAHDGRTKAHA